MLQNVPKEIDGATVLYIGEAPENFGYVSYRDEENKLEIKRINIAYLAICRCIERDDYYLFACDKDFNALHDFLFSTVEECFEVAKKHYKVNTINWTKSVLI